MLREFSPHTRGCSYLSQKPPTKHQRFPRIRGDVPKAFRWITDFLEFSPHTRGCSVMPVVRPPILVVFPAYAGMFPARSPWTPPWIGFPRVCGDVPAVGDQAMGVLKFSPRMRGCSCLRKMNRSRWRVFPAYAGMFRAPRRKLSARSRFPRVCGDVPHSARRLWSTRWFSPRMRGCSYQSQLNTMAAVVFPAYAGMFLIEAVTAERSTCFPRVCGDVPCLIAVSFPSVRFSPRMRGCS